MALRKGALVRAMGTVRCRSAAVDTGNASTVKTLSDDKVDLMFAKS